MEHPTKKYEHLFYNSIDNGLLSLGTRLPLLQLILLAIQPIQQLL